MRDIKIFEVEKVNRTQYFYLTILVESKNVDITIVETYDANSDSCTYELIDVEDFVLTEKEKNKIIELFSSRTALYVH